MELTKLLQAQNVQRRHGEHIILRLTYISRYNSHNENGDVTCILA